MEYNQVIANIWEFCCEKVITRIWIKRCEIVAEIDKERGVNKKDLKKRKQMDRDERDENKEVKNNKNRKTNDDDKNQKNLEKKIKLKAAFKHIKLWAHQQGFFVRKGRPEKVQSRRRKQTIVCRCEGAYNQINHQNHIEQIHFGHNLDTSASHFEASKAFTKPMLNDIECINQRLYYVSRSIKFRTIQIKPNRDDHQITNGLEIDQENVGQIGNPIIRRPKGRPPGTARFKRPLEASNEGNKSRKCGLCNESGHNRTTCPVNTNRRKERMMIR
ncbi:hypothetical protein RhiirA1_468732 [Rhizophagus irregularis]|uniref:CCHC-type domain-containing protein n=1 Tax=Rhizophagus irregularis TaxID=588596 RepID=A0A2N0R9G4_9GLOM|nr:hypothetical protein RhiirA1_468732 [Rhizophagus irregularis]